MVKRERITVNMDNRIVTGLIVSDEFCRRVLPLLHKEYFQSDYATVVFQWVQQYYQQYKTAPGKNIQEVYRDRRGELEDAMRSLIKEFLSGLSQSYAEEGTINVEYEVDRATQHIRKRSIEVHIDRMQKAFDMGKFDKVEQEISSFKKTIKPTTGWIDPLDPVVIREALEQREEDNVFRFPGQLGELSKDHQRGWLCMILAPMKRGKSFMLQEVAVSSMIQRRKVVFFSLEMQWKQMEHRILSRLTATSPDAGGDFLYPVFDCVANQDGTCKKPQRVNKIRLLMDDGTKPIDVDQASKYRACTACRGTKEKKDYKLATWYDLRRRDQMTAKSASRKAASVRSMNGSLLRMKAYPMYSANLSMLRSDLDMLEHTEGFIPDVIVIDYADILAPEDARVADTRQRLDETWKSLKRIAQEKHCLVFTASQGTRKSIKKQLLGQEDTAEDIRKIAHCDMCYALNQSGVEKAEGLMRISVIAHRHADFNEESFATVLQQRGLALMNLDSELHLGIRKRDHFSYTVKSQFDEEDD